MSEEVRSAEREARRADFGSIKLDNPQFAIGNTQSKSPRSALRAPRWLSPAVVILVFFLNAALFMGLPGDPDARYAWCHLPLDDAWIHLAYAKGLLAHGYFVYNPGEVETGATSPLWAALLAAGLAVLRHPVLAAKALGLLLGAACLGLGFVELRRIGGRVAAWTGTLLLALDPMWVMSCASGMEIPLAALLLVVVARQARLGRPLRTGAALGLLGLTRPEMALPGAGAGLLLLWALLRRRPWGGALRGWLGCAAAALAIGLPWLLYCRLGTGHWLPCSFYVKGAGYLGFGLEKLRIIFLILEHGFWPSPLVHDPTCLALLALGLAYAAAAPWRRRLGPPLWLALLALHLAAWSLMSPLNTSNDHRGDYLGFFNCRYFIPDYVLFFGLAGLGAGSLGRGIAWLGRRLQTGLAPRADRLARRGLAAAIPALLVAGNFYGWWCGLGSLWQMGESYRKHWGEISYYNQAACRNIYEIHERAGHWIAANLPPDRVVATQDAGAIRYFTTQPLVDLWGLNSHAYLFAKDKGAYLRQRGVNVAAVFHAGRLDPLYDFKNRRVLVSFETIPNRISEGDLLEIREVE